MCFLIILFQPIPIDSINKYWGVDAVFSKHDETLQKQSFDQSNKNFWSFVDYNMNNSNMNENMSAGASGFRNTSNNQTINSNTFSGSGLGGSGFSGFRSGGMETQNMSYKISGLSYQEAKMKSTNN